MQKFDAKTGLILTVQQFQDLRGDDWVSEWYHLPEVKNGFDSEAETRKHIARVSYLLMSAIAELSLRAANHDASKLSEAEKPYFDAETPKLRSLKFGTDEYAESLARLKPALDHHYAKNSHHPQHYENGIEGMDLFDLLEMLCDWKAAGERDNGGNIFRSIEINAERFGIAPQLVAIFINHAKRHLEF